MSRSLAASHKQRGGFLAWRQVGAPLFAALLMLAIPSARAGLLDKLLHPQSDSGTGKVARLAFRLDDRSFYPTKVTWSPDGRFIATDGATETTIHIWDVAQRKLIKVLQSDISGMGNQYSPNMAWSSDGRYLVACNDAFRSPFSVRIYATKDWSVVKDLGPRDGVSGCITPAFSSDGQELTVWGRNLTTFATSDWHVIRQIKSVGLTRAFSNVVKAWYNRIILLYDMVYVPGTHTLVLGGGGLTKGTGMCLDAAPSRYAHNAGLVYVVNPEDTALPPPHVVYCSPRGREVALLAVNPDGKTLTTVTGMMAGIAGPTTENYTRVLRIADGKDVTPTLGWHSENAPGALVYTPDGRFLIMGEAGLVHTDHPVYIVDARTMQLLDTVHAPPDVLDIAVAPDSSGFAVATGTGVTVWTFVRH